VYAQQNIAVMYTRGDGVKQDFQRALFWFRKAATQGDSFAQYSIGLRYLNGEGVQQDYSEALSWFKKAADQGFTQAFYQIGMMYAQGNGVRQDFREAVAWTRRAADLRKFFEAVEIVRYDLQTVFAIDMRHSYQNHCDPKDHACLRHY
jgi:uncharacterized protein